MISVVIPTLNAERELAGTLAALIPAAVDGLVREVIIVDGGSTDATLAIADAAGADIVQSERGRGQQLRTGAEKARFPWLLFLHADTVLEPGWHTEAADFIQCVESGQHPTAAAAFRFTLNDAGFLPRTMEVGVALRCGLLKLPYGDQGLLLSSQLYRKIGGYNPIPLMEDVEIVRSLGRRRVVLLRSQAITSAARYRRNGYVRQISRNLLCLTLYFLCVPPKTIARLYR